MFIQIINDFTDGAKYLYGNNGKVNINNLTRKHNIDNLNKYFRSGIYNSNRCFETIDNYKFKFPNYFKNFEHIRPETKLEAYYYETFNENNCA